MQKLMHKSFPLGDFEVYSDKPDFKTIYQVHQIHSADVVSTFTSETKADGLIIPTKDLDGVIAIKTADCLPVLYYSDDYIALIHAGWRGLKSGILHHRFLDKKWDEIFIGPCIHKESFEVQADFKTEFPSSSNFIYKDSKIYFDLVSEATQQLQKTFPDTKITSSDMCTFKNPDYNSYRRDKTQKRNWNIFRLRG